MLVQFSVKNFASFKDEVTLSMVAAPIKEFADTHTYEAPGKLRILKSAAVYGANASGKSNLFAAIRFMRWFILNSSTNMQAKEKIKFNPFRLHMETLNMPSRFEMIFIIDKVRYRYGFEIDQKSIKSEWFFKTSRVRNEVMLFERIGDKFELSQEYSEGQGLNSKTRDNALFLSVVSQFNGKISNKAIEWFDKLRILSGLHDRLYTELSNEMIEDKKVKVLFLNIIKKADLGIEDLSVEKSELVMDSFPKEFQAAVRGLESVIHDDFPKTITDINVYHNCYDQNNKVVSLQKFDLEFDESQGTKKLFSLLGPIIFSLAQGDVLVIDELDSSLHPLITRFIINLFNHKTNDSFAQLIFNTHDTNLLSNKIFRRDQIWFTEKDRYGASDLYSLVEYKVRNDASYEKDYLLGKYGSIPYLGNFDFNCCVKEETDIGK